VSDINENSNKRTFAKRINNSIASLLIALRSNKSIFFRISVPVFFVVLILVVRKIIDYETQQSAPYLLFSVAIVLSSVLAGIVGGFLATLISIVFIISFFLAPSHSLTQPLDWINIILFLIQGGVVTYIVNLLNTVLEGERALSLSLHEKEEYYRKIMSRAKDAIIVSTLEGKIVDANKSASLMFGWSPGELLEQNIVELVHPDSLSKTPLQKEELIKNKQFTIERLLRTQSGKYILVDISASLLDSTRVVSILRDITERREEEEKTRTINIQLEAIINSTQDFIAVKDCEGNYIIANPVACELLQKSQEQIIGKDDCDLFPVEVGLNIYNNDKKIMYSGVSELVEEKLIFQNKERVFLSSKTPLKSSQGDIEGIIVISRDITERKLNEARKDEFLGIASHELKTPLTSVKGYIQILGRILERTQEERAKMFVNKAQVYIERLSTLIGELLDISRIQSGKFQFNFEEFNCDDLVREGIESAWSLAEGHIITQKGNSGGALIYGDKHRLEQVFTNLISNAIKYSPNEKTITVQVDAVAEGVKISVIDQGVGVPKDKSEQIFEKFIVRKKPQTIRD
jgi:PAS domain S-box-containing protein